MISSALLARVQCPECAIPLLPAAGSASCPSCGREFPTNGSYLDLRPRAAFAEQTKYLDEDLHADARHEAIAPPLLGSKVRFDMLRRFLAPAAGDRIVDLGCGSGRALAWNVSSGASMVGVDISPFFAPEATQRFDLLLGDLRRLPLQSGAFNKAWSLDVFEHLSPQAFQDVLSEAHRVLDRNGVLFMYTHVRTNGWIANGVRAMNALAHAAERIGWIDLKQERLRKSDHLNPIVDHAQLRDVAARCGFEIERITYYTPIIGAFVENVAVRIGERLLVRRARKRAVPGQGADAAMRQVRKAAQARVRARGLTYRALLAATAVMKLDVWLFGRLQSGPFFALLRKTDATRVAGS